LSLAEFVERFINCDLGFFGQECGRITGPENPFDANVDVLDSWRSPLGLRLAEVFH
jgi:hypothetical protein